jgi:putative tryptophan/tyrosine transport system substrate-binding protein
MPGMRRRDFVTLLGGATLLLAAKARRARAQQPAMPTVGFLNTASPDPYAERVHAFRQGLSEAGYIEGQNVVVEYRWAEGRYDRLQAMVAELVRRQVAVIAATGGAAPVLAAKAATATIPIVFQAGVDPVDAGLVASLSRPGGNVTGVTNLNVELGAKRLELLRELIPTATVVALLVNPTNPNAETLSRDVQAAALTLGQQIHVLRASTGRELETAFATLGDLRANGLVIGADGFFVSRSEQLATLAVRHKLPTIFQFRQFAAAGGLMSYGGSFTEQYRGVGIYTGRILKGERPADLPVVQATKVELIINLKTAKALGLTFPVTLLGRADEVIE